MELWDIYDRNKQRTGRTMKRNDWHMQPGDFHLTVLGVIRHVNGKYLITKRVMTKAWAPGCWEVSGGAAQAGEDSLDAVKREIKEETGLDVSSFDGGFVFSYTRENPDEGDNYFVDIYRFTGDFSEADLHLQEAETDELINKVYDGSADKLFAALLGRKKLSAQQIEKLRQIVGELE